MGKATVNKKKKIKPVRVAVIGCTKAAEKHLEALAAMPETKPIAVCDVDEEKVKVFRKKYKIRRGYTNYLKMLRPSRIGRKIDAVHVCLPDAACALVASYCLLNKCDVMIEPPMAFDLDAVRDAIKNADYMSKSCAVVPPMRSEVLFDYAKAALAEGRIGKILSVRSVICLAAPAAGEDAALAKTPDELLFGVMAPAIDLVDALVEDDVSGLSCSMANRAHEADRAADSAEGVITYVGGVKHSFYCTGNYENGGSTQTAIVCEHGEILFEGADVRISYEDGTKDELHDDAVTDGFLAALREFYEACREGRAPATDVRGALRLHEILLGLYTDAMAHGVGSAKPPKLSVAGKTKEEASSKKPKIWY